MVLICLFQFLPYAIKKSEAEPYLEIARTTINSSWTGSGPFAGVIEPMQGSGKKNTSKKFTKGLAKIAKENTPLILRRLLASVEPEICLLIVTLM